MTPTSGQRRDGRTQRAIDMNDEQHRLKEAGAVMKQIAELIRQLRYGTIEIVVHDGHVVQIQRRERFRFSNPSGNADRSADE
jgi:hypothetical protein